MTVSELVAQFGVHGLIIGGLGIGVIRLWNRLNEVQDGRLQDYRETSRQQTEAMREVGRSLDALTDVVRGRRDV